MIGRNARNGLVTSSEFVLSAMQGTGWRSARGRPIGGLTSLGHRGISEMLGANGKQDADPAGWLSGGGW